LALDTLKLGEVMDELDAATVAQWLANSHSPALRFPDVASAVTEWLMQGDLAIEPSWIRSVWDRCERLN
jgi:hypothetical protein